ncbi:hypothetical protein CY96_29180 (plasmid) [Bacillus bombysepticus str. Wang]|uniref:Uncharacterized protein n=1 Tax=Bacillus bombysepticus str. Wang TaxID=1330043 RepID=A0A9W3KYC6_9BACI|nr:hypothetical protein CY96_29180 [Bacillus bombysepticus str. Wang]
MMTLVWLYLEILRFVSYFMKKTKNRKNPACFKHVGFFYLGIPPHRYQANILGYPKPKFFY